MLFSEKKRTLFAHTLGVGNHKELDRFVGGSVSTSRRAECVDGHVLANMAQVKAVGCPYRPLWNSEHGVLLQQGHGHA